MHGYFHEEATLCSQVEQTHGSAVFYSERFSKAMLLTVVQS